MARRISVPDRNKARRDAAAYQRYLGGDPTVEFALPADIDIFVSSATPLTTADDYWASVNGVNRPPPDVAADTIFWGGRFKKDTRIQAFSGITLYIDAGMGRYVPIGAVPSPVAVLDFKGGVYSINGVSKTLAEVCVQDLNWGSYSATDVVAGVGYIQENGDTGAGPVLSAAAYAAVGNEFVAVTRYKYEIGVEPIDRLSISLGLANLPTYSSYCDWIIGETFYDQSALEDETGIISDLGSTGYSDGSHCIAARFTSTQIAISVDGKAPVSATTTDQSGSNTVALWINCTGSDDSAAIIEKVEFYALADYDVTNLPFLSGQ